MVESNKILTVSYGTFSCTLEGFDDAFDTMKAIAEYFRDLAAEDRYFGAEPPTPDADMLARLAERSLSRRVMARTEEGKVVLRPGIEAEQHAGAPAAAEAAPVEPAPVQAPTVQMPSAEPAVEAAVEAAAQMDTPAVARVEEVEAEDVAPGEMPLRALRAPRIAAALAAAGDAALLAAGPVAAVARPAEDVAPAARADLATEPAQPPAVEAPADLSDPAPLQDLVGTAPVAPNAEEPISEEAVSEDPAFAPDENGSTAPALPEVEETLAEAAAPLLPEEPDQAFLPDEGAASLPAAEDLIGEEAAQAEAEAALLADMPDEGAAPIAAHTFAAPSFDAPAFEADAFDSLDEIDPEAAPVAAVEEDLTPQGEGWDSIAEAQEAISRATVEADLALHPARPDVTDVALKLQRIRDVVARRAAIAAATSAEAAPVAAPVAATIAAAPIALPDETPVPPIAGGEADFSSAIGSAEAPEEDDDFDAAGDDSLFAEGADDATAPRVMARVVKVKRREEAQAPSSLSPEDEAELQRELAQIEAEITRGHAAPVAPAEAAEATVAEDEPGDRWDTWDGSDADQDAASGADQRPARSSRDTLSAADHNAQMDRILRETDHQFEQEDSTRRRSALAHLRAAVAAKKAEKAAGSDFAPREDTTDAYREDLAQVVRPRRPAIAHRSETPARPVTEKRPAPLKLVAEQRIDTSGVQPRTPVRPRRISIADLARHDRVGHGRTPLPDPVPARAPDQGFDDYADQVGASTLGELLEAAASYISFMEGQPLFSRPQLMARVKSTAPAEFTREDGLRAFGQLLREGKIRKAEAGRFTVSDSIGFRPEERAAG